MSLRSGDKHHLRKSAERKAQISPVSGTNAFLICAFRSADFFRWRLPSKSKRNLMHSLLFLFSIIFCMNLIKFSMRRRTVQPEIRSFVSVLRSPVTRIDRGKTKSASFTKNGNSFEERNVFGMKRKVWTSRHFRGEKLRGKILARKSAKLIANFSAAVLRWRHLLMDWLVSAGILKSNAEFYEENFTQWWNAF